MLAAVLLFGSLGCTDDNGADSTTSSSTSTTAAGGGTDENPGKPLFNGTLEEIAPGILENLKDRSDKCATAQYINSLAGLDQPQDEDQTKAVIEIISESYLAMAAIIDPAATAERELLETAADAILEAGENWDYDPDTFTTNIDTFNAELIPAFKRFNAVLDDCVLGGIGGGTPDGVPDSTPANTPGPVAPATET